MRLDITEILSEVGKRLPYDIQLPPLVDEDVECTRPIQGRLVFTNAGDTLLIEGKATTTVALPCSRCVEYFEMPVALTLDEQFELKHIKQGARTQQIAQVVEEDENPVAGRLFEGAIFHLSELLRQYILLEAPTQPLPPLQEDGRCVHCKRLPAEALASLTGSSEPPAEAPVNPAFAKLGQLLQNGNKT